MREKKNAEKSIEGKEKCWEKYEREKSTQNRNKKNWKKTKLKWKDKIKNLSLN